MAPTVRRGEAQDGPGLYAAWQSLREHDAALDPRVVQRPVSEAEFVREWQISLGRPAAVAFVAEDGGRIVGFVSGSLEPAPAGRQPEQHATIGFLYVDPAHRRRGLGRRLFEAMSSWAVSREGVTHFEMTVLAANQDAVAFWRSLGFTPFIERLWAPLPESRK